MSNSKVSEAAQRRKDLLFRTTAHLMKATTLSGKTDASATSNTDTSSNSDPTLDKDAVLAAKKKKQLKFVFIGVGILLLVAVLMPSHTHKKKVVSKSVAKTHPMITAEALQVTNATTYPELSSTLPAELASTTSSAIPEQFPTIPKVALQSPSKTSKTSNPAATSTTKHESSAISATPNGLVAFANTTTSKATDDKLASDKQAQTTTETQNNTSTDEDIATFTNDEKMLILSQLQLLQQQNLDLQKRLTQSQQEFTKLSSVVDAHQVATDALRSEFQKTQALAEKTRSQVEHLLATTFNDLKKKSTASTLRILGNHQAEINNLIYHVGDPLTIRNKTYIILKIDKKNGVYVQDKAGQKFKLRENSF